MEKCRICLQYKKSLCSVFEGEKGITFADMMKSVAKIKIIDAKHRVCLQCRRKLRNLYDFKKQVERSDLEITRYLNIIHFDDIDDVKAMLVKEENAKTKVIDSVDNYISLLTSGCDSIIYKNITITKVNPNNSTGNMGNLPVLNDLPFCNNIKCENNSDCDHVEYCDDTDEYDHFSDDDQSWQPKKQNKDRKKQGIEKKKVKKRVIQRVCIKPVVLNYLKKLSSRKKPNTHTRKTNNKRIEFKKRQDMCPHCGVMSTNLGSHILIHTGERKYKCSECNKAFFSRGQLNCHQKRHFIAKTFKCDKCVAVFNSKSSLASHMVSHMDIKNYICPVCNKGFKRKNALKRHKLIHLSSAKSVKCERCNMTFLSNQGLRHHMRVHTGERPFKCEICVQPYSYKHDFNRHCLTKHGVFLKRRSVHVMNQDLLIQEQALMKDLMLRVQGVVKEGEPLNPFSGPQAAMAFQQAVKDLGNK